MPEDLRDDVQRRSLRQHQRGPRVPQFMRMPVAEGSVLGRLGGCGEGACHRTAVHDVDGDTCEEGVVLPWCGG